MRSATREADRTSWHDFIVTHKDVLAATDFFTQEVWQRCRLVTFYVLFFIHIGSRRVHVAVITPSPDHNVVEQDAREVTFVDDGFLEGCKYLIHDRDAKYTRSFDEIIESVGIEVIKVPRRSPNLNAFAERWVRSIKSECLDRLILFGERSLRYAIRSYLAHYHAERPHQGLDNTLIDGHKLRPKRGDVRCRERLGGAPEVLLSRLGIARRFRFQLDMFILPARGTSAPLLYRRPKLQHRTRSTLVDRRQALKLYRFDVGSINAPYALHVMLDRERIVDPNRPAVIRCPRTRLLSPRSRSSTDNLDRRERRSG
jgi:hypothetical protein